MGGLVFQSILPSRRRMDNHGFVLITILVVIKSFHYLHSDSSFQACAIVDKVDGDYIERVKEL